MTVILNILKKFYFLLALCGFCCCAGFSLVGESWGYSHCNCNMWASHCGGFSCCKAQPLDCRRLQLLQFVTSVVLVPRL